MPQNGEVAARSPPLAAGRTDARYGPACVGFIDRNRSSGPGGIAKWEAIYKVRRKSIKPLSSFQGVIFFFRLTLTSQLSNALAFISRSTSAYTFVVNDTCPSHARIVLMSTPERRRCVAVVWRIVCGLTRFLAKLALSSSPAHHEERVTGASEEEKQPGGNGIQN